jgi:hypothetical protein
MDRRRKKEERVVNEFGTWCWRRMLKITNGEFFQRAKEERLLLKIVKNRRRSWVGHIISQTEFVVNIL